MKNFTVIEQDELEQWLEALSIYRESQKRNNGDLKGKRFNLLFYKTYTLEALKVLARFESASVNALINKILVEYIRKRSKDIDLYKNLF